MTSLETLRRCLELVDELEETLSQLRLAGRFYDEIDNLRSGLCGELASVEAEKKKWAEVLAPSKES